MRNLISYTALGIALAAGVSVAQAQTIDDTVIAQGPVVTVPAPVVTAPAVAPVETVETVRTVHTTTRPARRVIHARDNVTTTRTTVSERVVPAPVAPVAAIAPSYPGLYDVVTPAPVVSPPMVPPVPAAVAPVTAVGAAAVVPSYRYVYEPDRILVIDPYTNVAVQAIPR